MVVVAAAVACVVVACGRVWQRLRSTDGEVSGGGGACGAVALRISAIALDRLRDMCVVCVCVCVARTLVCGVITCVGGMDTCVWRACACVQRVRLCAVGLCVCCLDTCVWCACACVQRGRRCAV